MAQQEYRSIFSILALIIGLAIPLLFQDHLGGGPNVLNDLIDHAKQYVFVQPVNPLLSLTSVVPLDKSQTWTSAERLVHALSREHGKWDADHPRRRLLDGMKGYMQYREGRLAQIKIWETRFRDLPRSEKQLIDNAINYTGKLSHVRSLMQENAFIAEAILQTGLEFYNISREELNDYVRETKDEADTQSGNVMYALKHIVRDWTTEGLLEREPTFSCLLDAVRKSSPTTARPRVLVPGAALGRLAHEIANLGDFDVSCNELSAEMILAYRWVRSLKPGSTATIYPNVDWWSHRPTTASLVRGISFPDDEDLLFKSGVELLEGDFTKALKHVEGSFDVIVTYFFIDTARNLLSYLKTIHMLLRPGGVWINHGPLLYGSKPAIQLSLDEVILLAESIGLQLQTSNESCGESMAVDQRVRGRIVPYSGDSQSLSRNAYLAQHWIAKKTPANN